MVHVRSVSVYPVLSRNLLRIRFDSVSPYREDGQGVSGDSQGPPSSGYLVPAHVTNVPRPMKKNKIKSNNKKSEEFFTVYVAWYRF